MNQYSFNEECDIFLDNLYGIFERLGIPNNYLKFLLKKINIEDLKNFIDSKNSLPIIFSNYDTRKVSVIDINLYRIINDVTNVFYIYAKLHDRLKDYNYNVRGKIYKLDKNYHLKIIKKDNNLEKIKFFRICNYFLTLINKDNNIINPITDERYSIELSSIYEIINFYQRLFTKGVHYNTQKTDIDIYIPKLDITDIEYLEIINYSLHIIPNVITRILKCDSRFNINYFTQKFNLNSFINNFKTDILADIKNKLSMTYINHKIKKIIIAFRLSVIETLNYNSYVDIIVDTIFLTISKHILCISLKYIILSTGNAY